MTQALIVVDAQNEFSAEGKRPVPNHVSALAAIADRIDQARRDERPIAWVRHHNKPDESPAFIPHSWGAEFRLALGRRSGSGQRRSLRRTCTKRSPGTNLETWLHSVGAEAVLIVGFYAHICLSTSAREALIRGFDVSVDPGATGARDLEDPVLGRQTADEVRRSTLLHLTNMGVTLATGRPVADATAHSRSRADEIAAAKE